MASTMTGLVPGDATPVVGENVTWTATVTVTGLGSASPTAPTGNVNFTFDGGATTTVALTGNTATFSAGALTQGAHTVTASYVGDTNFSGSTAAPFGRQRDPGQYDDDHQLQPV